MAPLALSSSHSNSVDLIIGIYLTDGGNTDIGSGRESPEDTLAMRQDPGTLVLKGPLGRALGVNSRKMEGSGCYRTNIRLSL